MSGITGIFNYNGAPIEPGQLHKMTSAISHRGPDGIHHWHKGPVALGHCMLRTTPESLEETQPLENTDASLIIVMDGRIDNCSELRQALILHGAKIRNCTDAELVLHAYEIWGDTCVDHLIGEFVFFIWDTRQNQLFAARDAVGTRHFYYYQGNGWFAFASEIKGLLALKQIEPRLNESRIVDFLVPEYDRDDIVSTFYQGIQRLPAGHAMVVNPNQLNIWRYWHPDRLTALYFKSQAECTEAFLEQLRTSVQCRLRSIGPVGAMLSGGLDSSSIVGLIRKDFSHELQQPLNTFSLIREDRENCPDWHSIEAMLQGGGVNPNIMTSGMSDAMCRSFMDTIDQYDEPFALSHGLTYALVYQASQRQGCRIVLDGMAGDILFHGPDQSINAIIDNRLFFALPGLYSAYRRHDIEHFYRKLTRRILVSLLPEPIKSTYRRYRTKFDLSIDSSKILHAAIAQPYLANKYATLKQNNIQTTQTKDQALHTARFTGGLLSFAHEVYGEIAFAHGVEPRSPFSDRRLVEFAICMPMTAKLSVPSYKATLRSAMIDILPEAVRKRDIIGGHPGWAFYKTLIKHTLNNPNEFLYILNNSTIINSHVDTQVVNQLYNQYQQNEDYDSGLILFSILLLHKWAARNQMAN